MSVRTCTPVDASRPASASTVEMAARRETRAAGFLPGSLVFSRDAFGTLTSDSECVRARCHGAPFLDRPSSRHSAASRSLSNPDARLPF